MSESERAHPPPRVTRLFTTPIKGFVVNESDSVRLGSNGAVGDRDFFVIDEDNELLSITRTGAFASWRAKFEHEENALTLVSADGQVREGKVVEEAPVVVDFWESRQVEGKVVGGLWSSWLSDIADRPVSLVRANDPSGAFDERPVTLLSEESVAEVGRLTNSEGLDIRRFRMLINISGVAPYEEESWRPKTARIGSALLRMSGPVPRCNATTRNPDSGAKDLKTLGLISAARGMQPNEFGEGLNLGVYAEVVEPGVVSVGDRVELA